MSDKPAASIDVAVIRQRFNWDWTASEAVDGVDTYWWWARSIRVDPNEIIADDDEGGLWRIPFTTDGADEVTFGEPERVRETFVPIAEPAAAAADLERRHGQRVMAARLDRPDKPEPASASTRPTTEEDHMDPVEIRRNLGLAEDATDEDVEAAFALARGEKPADDEGTVTETTTGTVEEPVVAAAASAAGPKMVEVSEATLAELSSQAQSGAAARRTQLEERRDKAVTDGVLAGRFPAADKAAWTEYPDKYPEGFEAGVASLEARISSMKPGLIPVDERGGAPSPESADEDSAMAAARASFGLTPKGA